MRARGVVGRRVRVVAAGVDDAAAGEAQESRLQVRNLLGEVLAQAVVRLPFQVSFGNSETMSSRTVPVPCTTVASRPAPVDDLGDSVTSYLAHLSPLTLIDARSSRAPSGVSNVTARFVPAGLDVRAQTE